MKAAPPNAGATIKVGEFTMGLVRLMGYMLAGAIVGAGTGVVVWYLLSFSVSIDVRPCVIAGAFLGLVWGLYEASKEGRHG
jgi:sulfite exporter TauE/SafE